MPRRFTFRQLFSDLRLSEAAQCNTESVDAASSSYSSVRQPEARSRKIAAENADRAAERCSRKAGKSKCNCSECHNRRCGFAIVGGANQKIQRFAVPFEKPRRQIGSDIAGRAGEEDGHVAQALAESLGWRCVADRASGIRGAARIPRRGLRSADSTICAAPGRGY